MAKGFDKLNVKSARKANSKMNLDSTHLTTMNFGEIVPLYINELVPGDKFSIKGNYFSRMAPLVKPTYGKFSFKTVAGFVPSYQLADDAEAYLAGKTVWEGSTPSLRYFTVDQLAQFLQATCTGGGSTEAAGDFKWTSTAGTTTYYKWSVKGKLFVKILNALGYAVPTNIDYQTSSDWYTNERTKKLNAMPLLAYAKLYNDYMSQSQRYNISVLTAFLKAVKHKVSYSSYYNASTNIITSSGINLILSNILLAYENDYFTSAWQYANAPLNASESVASMLVPQTQGSPVLEDTVRNNIYDTYLDSEAIGANDSLGQRALDFLKSFDDWVRRNNYSGSRAVQQIYSRFGIKTDDYRSNYAKVISTDTMPIQVGDVTATADSTNVPLGDYSGKGIMSGSDGFSFDSSDYGYLIVLGYYTVIPMNAYGFDRMVLRTEALDFYNPEFDGLGADAISYGEVFANPVAASTDTSLDSSVFGFTERYNAYRFGHDRITGEFRNTHSDADMNTWHTGRILSDVRKAGNMVAQSSTMNTLAQTNSEYNRIFSVPGNATGDEDKFYLTAQFNVTAVRPMLSLNQVPRLGEGDTSVPRNGNVIS